MTIILTHIDQDMNYTLHQLKIFTEVVKQKSITLAAEEMHMTQPALSIQLKNFQSQFDIPLTEIIGKKLKVTDFGMEIAELAESILVESDKIKYKTKAYEGALTGKLKIAAASTGKYVIPYFLPDFLKSNPGIDLVLDVSNKSEVIKSLLNHDVDFALVSVIPENLFINEEILIENKLYMVSPNEESTQDLPLIYREEGSATRKSMIEYFKDSKERKSITLTSNEAVKQAVMAGIGISILPLIGIKSELINKDLHIVKSFDLPLTTNWRLIWLKDRKLSPIANEYLKFVRANKYDIIQEQFDWYLKFNH